MEKRNTAGILILHFNCNFSKQVRTDVDQRSVCVDDKGEKIIKKKQRSSTIEVIIRVEVSYDYSRLKYISSNETFEC
jgi:hypothetical protein